MHNSHRSGKLNLLEVVEAFRDDYKEVVKVNDQYIAYERYLSTLRSDVDTIIDRTFGVSVKDKQFIRDVLNSWIDFESEDFHRVRKQYDIICGMMKPGQKGSPHRIQQEDIERARLYPIENLLKFNRAGKVHCIFHNDTSNPNLHKYDNTVYCFSCQRKADVIDVYMQQTGDNFIDAVKKLSS